MRQVAGENVDCLCVGILVADHLCDPIDHCPAAGELVISQRLPLAIGGCASNVAVDLTRLGARAGVIGCVGQDAFGRFIVDSLLASGVETAGIRMLADAETSGTLIINVRGEDRRFVHAPGANARLQAADIPWPRVQSSKVLYVGGYLLMPALEGEPLASLFRRARAAGVRTVLDIVLPGPGDHLSKLAAVLPHTDVFLPNHDEAAVLTGSDDPLRQAEQFVNAGAGAAIITCGERGAVLVTRDMRVRVAAHLVDYVGGTGAGDAFVAGLIAGLLEGEELPGALAWAGAAGASCVRSISATDGVFTRDEALEFMRARPLAIEPL